MRNLCQALFAFFVILHATSTPLIASDAGSTPYWLVTHGPSNKSLYLRGCDSATLNDVPGTLVSDLDSITAIRARGCDFTDPWLLMMFLTYFPRLLELTVHNCNVTTLNENLFKSTPCLTDINFSGNQITSLPAGLFAPLSNLSSIDFSDNKITRVETNIALNEVGEDSCRLVYFSFARNPITFIDPLFCKKLSPMSLAHCFVRTDEEAPLGFIASWFAEKPSVLDKALKAASRQLACIIAFCESCFALSGEANAPWDRWLWSVTLPLHIAEKAACAIPGDLPEDVQKYLEALLVDFAKLKRYIESTPVYLWQLGTDASEGASAGSAGFSLTKARALLESTFAFVTAIGNLKKGTMGNESAAYFFANIRGLKKLLGRDAK